MKKKASYYMKKFVIEFVDPITECVSNEFVIETSNVVDLSEIVISGGGDLRPSGVYDLNPENLDQIEALLGIQIERSFGAIQLRSWGFNDDLPYVVHGDKELALMLKGEKPLAVFFERHPSDPGDSFIPEHLFAPYVEAGLFFASEFIIADVRGGENRFVLYAAKGEEWRIPAYILLQKTVIFSGWNAGFTRMEGSLLGYEDWQNDIFIERCFKSVR